VRAFADALRFVGQVPPMRLVIAGEGPDREAIRRLAAELGVGDRLELPGQLSRDELRALYAGAHAFVLPSERESFGIAALEARAAGLPVIAMLASGARDFIRHGVDGLLARDSRELSRLIVRLAVDGSFHAYLLAHNAASAPPYDWSEVADLHERFYGVAAALLRDTASRASQR
jgi:glycosyltransferase involved in cell wall biosynthesis